MAHSVGFRIVGELVVILLLAGAGATYAQLPPAVSKGATWLQAQIQADGSVVNTNGVATNLQSESEILQTLTSLGISNGSQAQLTFELISAEPYNNTENLSRKIFAAVNLAQDSSVSVTALLANQGADGGFGELPGYQSTVYDTAYALQALNAAGQGNTTTAQGGVGFLLSKQAADGSWADWPGTDTAYSTALVIEALAPYRASLNGIGSAIQSADTYLASARQVNTDWGESFLNAQVIIALVAGNAESALVTSAAADLGSAQQTDGSWGDDPFATALALRALTAAQDTAPPTQPAGSIAGYVVEAGTARPISGATVFSASNPSATTTTNGDGYYTLANLPPGQYTFVASAPGYASASVVASILSSVVAQAPNLVLAQGTATSLVYGRIVAQQGGAPIAGASVQLAGSDQYSVTTGADGSFAFGAVAPGQYTLQITAAGYISDSGSVSFSAGSQYQINQALLLNGTYASSSPIEVTASVVDAKSGQAISGAKLSLNALLAGTAATDGTVDITGVPPGTYQATLSAPGYATGLYTLMLPPGSNGQLGNLSLYPNTGTAAPTSLTLVGKVVSGVGGQPIAGASITRSDTGTTLTSGADGSFTLTGLTVLDFGLQIAASGYMSQQFSVTASGYGVAAETFTLPPSGGNAAATSVTLTGSVTDAATGAAIPNATVAVSESTLQVATDSTGSYQLANISNLSFTLQVSALGYVTQSLPITVSQFGNYGLNVQLTKTVPASGLQVLSVAAKSSTLAATDTGVFLATLGNTGGTDLATTLFAEVTNLKGNVVATVSGGVPGTATVPGEFTVPAASQIQAEFDWKPEQLPAGTYTVSVYAITPGTITRLNPHGVLLATGSTTVIVNPTEAISGQLAFNPPLVQAGTQSPVALSALVVNSGNVTLTGETLQLTVTDPATGKTVYSASGQINSLPVNNNVIVGFGSWLPTITGNLKVQVVPGDSNVIGIISGTLYVGNKASSEFTVDRAIVPPGNDTVHAKVVMQGVDVTQGVSTDPLFFAVQRAVTNGGAYVGTNAEQWQNAHQCLGCHIQSQSLVGLASSMGKATIDPQALKFLATALATSQQADSTYRLSYPQFEQTQTILNLWSLNHYQDNGTLFRNKLAAAMYLHGQRHVSGNLTYWYPDYWSGWWASQDKLTALATTGLVDVIQASKTADLSKAVSYTWSQLTAPNTVGPASHMDVGPDGHLYALENNGNIDAVDPQTGVVSVISITGLPGTPAGFAIGSDGSFYLSGNGYVAHAVASQAPTIVWRGSGNITALAVSPAGVLYGLNPSASQLLEFNGTSPTVVLNNQTLNSPSDLAFDAFGNLLIANTNNFNLVQLTPDGTVTTWALGLGQPPVRIASDGQGSWYVFSTTSYPLGFYNPPELYHFIPDGVGERIADASSLTGLAVLNGAPVSITVNGNHLVQLSTQPVGAVSELASLQQDVTGAAQYLLGTYKDGSTDVLTQSLRLWGMAEARKVVTDATLQNHLDQAVVYLDSELRGEQHADGGWGSSPGRASDALVTSVAGLALDYSHPSPQDTATRNAIQYLLNAQQGDGSWYSTDGIMSTRLSVTSLVMDYMPEALGFLGGLDVDLYVADSPQATFLNFVPPPGDTTIAGSGTSTYHWHLTGVTSTSREVDFDVNLPNMLANESRPVAGAAYMQFHNSFNNNLLTVNLAIPDVKAVSGLGITVGTDLAQYGANQPVTISGVVGNSGVPTTHAQVEVQILAPDGTLITTLAAASGLQIATGGQAAYTVAWNTGNYLPGTYQVKASVVDDTGTVANTANTSFNIVTSGTNGGEAATLRTTTDKLAYNTTDTVNIADLVQDVSANTNLSLVHLHVVVTGASGQSIQTYDHDLGQLVPGAQRNIPDTLVLDHAAQGQYTVAAAVTDATGSTLATDQAVFTVADQLTRSLTGHVTAQSASVYQGDTEICTDTVLNNGTQPLTNQPLQQLLVSMASGSALTTTDLLTDLAPGQQLQFVRSVGTGSMAVGDYACALQAQVNGAWNPLGYATFHVAPPPIKIAASMSVGAHGRVLILTDDPAVYPADQDPFGPSAVPGLAAQNQHLAEVLNRAGWSYTLVTNAADFEREFDTGGYEVYVVLSEAVKLPTDLQNRVVQAVSDGAGLIVAGNHDDRNSKLETALGVHTTGKSLNATGLVLDAGSLDPTGGQAAFPVDAEPASVNKVDATPVGEFLLSNGGTAPAVFTYDYGNGKSMYMPFDLALEEAAGGDNSLFDRLFLDSLNYVHPSVLTPWTGRVLPIVLTLSNQGIPTPGRAVITLPPGVTVIDPHGASVSGDTVTWAFDLTARGEVLPLTFWARLPDNAGSIDFTAVVQSGVSPDFKDQATADLLIAVEPRPAPPQAKTHQGAVIAHTSAGGTSGREQHEQ